jgi:YD repeat-containing protein
VKVNYDEATDILTVVLRDAPVAESDEDNSGVILDYDALGNLVTIEILHASARVTNPRSVTLRGGLMACSSMS